MVYLTEKPQELTGRIPSLHSFVAKQVRFLMNTFVEIAVYNEDESLAHQGMIGSFNEIRRIESLMSRFLAGSEISLINQAADRSEPVRVSSDVIYVLEEALKFGQLTNGAFAPTITPLINLWASVSRLGKLPDTFGINSILSLVDWMAVEIDEVKQTVRLALPGMALDLGGIAKGYAIDRAVAVLKSKGIENAVINVGGNIFAMGDEPSGTGWDIGIQDPLNETQVIGRINLHNEAISTSGSYERFFSVGNDKLSHIIDPRNGMPVNNNLLSVSVISRSAILGDALSTAVFVLGPDDGTGLINKFPDADGFMICRDNNQSELRIICSGNLKDRITFASGQYFRRY